MPGQCQPAESGLTGRHERGAEGVRPYGGRRPDGCGPVPARRGTTGARVDDVVAVAGRSLPAPYRAGRRGQAAMRQCDEDTGLAGALGDGDDPRLLRCAGRTQIAADLDKDGTAVALAEQVRRAVRGPRLRGGAEVESAVLRYAEQRELPVEADLLPAGDRFRLVGRLRETPPHGLDVAVIPRRDDGRPDGRIDRAAAHVRR